MGSLTSFYNKVFLAIIFMSSAALAAEDMKFDKGEIEIGSVKLSIELALSPAQHEHGLMYRNSLPSEYGMMFVFPDVEVRNFWMKNTYVDLSIGFFDQNKKLIDIQDMKSTSMLSTNLPTYPSKGPAKYALETPKGWFAKHKIKVGQKFRFLSPKNL